MFLICICFPISLLSPQRSFHPSPVHHTFRPNGFFFSHPHQRVVPTPQLQTNILFYSTPTSVPQRLFTNYSSPKTKFTYYIHNTVLSLSQAYTSSHILAISSLIHPPNEQRNKDIYSTGIQIPVKKLWIRISLLSTYYPFLNKKLTNSCA